MNCQETRKDGEPCTRKALKGQRVCASHGGRAKRKHMLDDAELRARLLNALSAGCYAEDAARAAGIHPATYFRWMEHGEADLAAERDSREREFYEAATRAKANARVAAVGYIRAAMKDDWRAAVAYLERTDPQKWARTERVHHSGGITTRRTDLTKLSDEELDQLEELTAQIGG